LKLMRPKPQRKKSEVDILKQWNATQIVNYKSFSRNFRDELIFFADEQTIKFGDNNLLSQVKTDKNLCKISTFVITLTDGTEVYAELSFGADHSKLVAELLQKHKHLEFIFQDAYGVTTLAKEANKKPPGIFGSIQLKKTAPSIMSNSR
jgi:hypothetical protein